MLKYVCVILTLANCGKPNKISPKALLANHDAPTGQRPPPNQLGDANGDSGGSSGSRDMSATGNAGSSESSGSAGAIGASGQSGAGDVPQAPSVTVKALNNFQHGSPGVPL